MYTYTFMNTFTYVFVHICICICMYRYRYRCEYTEGILTYLDILGRYEHPRHLMVDPSPPVTSPFLAGRPPILLSRSGSPYCTAFLSFFLKIDSLSTSLISFGSEFHPSTTLSPKLFSLVSVWANFFLIFHGFALAGICTFTVGVVYITKAKSITNDHFALFFPM
jgi:hypothetical protein